MKPLLQEALYRGFPLSYRNRNRAYLTSPCFADILQNRLVGMLIVNSLKIRLALPSQEQLRLYL